MSTSPPTHADVVVIGGGVIGGGVSGLSTAYTLARSGVGKVVPLDQGPFGPGSTCKAAGGVRAQFSDETNIVIGHYGPDVFERFHQLFDQEIDLRQNGYLFLLGDPPTSPTSSGAWPCSSRSASTAA